MLVERLIKCFNCGHSEPESNYSMMVIMTDIKCPQCGEVFIKKPLIGGLPGNLDKSPWQRKIEDEKYLVKKNRFTKRLGAV